MQHLLLHVCSHHYYCTLFNKILFLCQKEPFYLILYKSLDFIQLLAKGMSGHFWTPSSYVETLILSFLSIENKQYQPRDHFLSFLQFFLSKFRHQILADKKCMNPAHDAQIYCHL